MLEVKIKKTLPGFNLEVDFTIDQEILAILGPSGSGKTMTLKCVAGLLEPDEGRIALNGRVLFDSAARINLPARERKIGFVFQNYALFPHRTVVENMSYGIRRRPRHEVAARVLWLLEKMHIEGLGERYPRQLSSGQQQRVALARALSCEPEVLLLDEPFSALDTPRRERLEVELLAMQDFYRGDILFVTHDLAQGYKLGSRIAVYESGQVAQMDSKHRVITRPANRTAARLTGFRNLMEGRVNRVGDAGVWVDIGGLGVILRVANGGDTGVIAGQEVAVGIRSEHVRPVALAGENTVYGTVTRVVEGVTTLYYYLRPAPASGEGELEVSLSKTEKSDMLNGGSYHFSLPPEHLVIIT
jgi:molybdate transport system ATP-binding protein